MDDFRSLLSRASVVACLVLCIACTLGGSAVVPPDDVASLSDTTAVGDGASEHPCVQFTPRSVTVVPPSGVRVQLDAGSCGVAPPPLVPASSITVLEDGEAVDPAESGLEVREMRPSLRVSLLVLVDLSGSVAAAGRVEAVRAAVAGLATTLAGADANDTGPWLEVGVQAFATRSEPLREIVPFTGCPDVLAALDAPGALDAWRPADPATDLYGSIVRASDLLRARGPASNPDARAMLVIVSDGRDTVDTTARPLATAAARELDGAWAIATGDTADVSTLQALSSAGPAESLTTWSHVADAIRARILAYRAESATRFLIGYCSPKGGGEHRVTVEVHRSASDDLEVRMGPIRFDATGFTSGCAAAPVANPCLWGRADEHACGQVDGIPCGTCGTVGRCLACTDEGACLPPAP